MAIDCKSDHYAQPSVFRSLYPVDPHLLVEQRIVFGPFDEIGETRGWCMRIDPVDHYVSIQILLGATALKRRDDEIVNAVTGAKSDVWVAVVAAKKELLAKPELRRGMRVHIHKTIQATHRRPDPIC